MKTLTLLLLVFIFLYECKTIGRTRSLATENVALQIEYLGSCEKFERKDLSSLTIGKRNESCLNLNTDLQMEYFCTDIAPKKSYVHFVEIFESHGTPYTDFVLSFIPSRPFKVLDQNVTMTRNPKCKFSTQYCAPKLEFITDCTNNQIIYKNDFVISADRIYIATNLNTTSFENVCNLNSTTCCDYITSVDKTFCSNNDELLKFPEHYQATHKKPLHFYPNNLITFKKK